MKFRAIRVLIWGAALLLALGLAGCRTAPVYSVTDAPVTTTGSHASMDDVKNAILRAGAGLGWQMKEAEPGLIVGTLFLRSHMAQVDIPYSRNSYSINYKASSNLNYDGTKIHKNYNGWIQNLDHAIQAQLSTM